MPTMARVRDAFRADLVGARRAARSVAARTAPRDVLAFFVAVPAVLLAVEAAIRDESIFGGVDRAALRFPLTAQGLLEPSLAARAFASSYAHDSLWPHLANNLVLYVIAAASLYALAARVNRIRVARRILVLSLVCTPFVVAWGSLAYPVGGSTLGFSGCVAAVLGALPAVLFAAADDLAPVRVDPRWSAPPVFLVVTGVCVVGGLPGSAAVAAAAATVVVTVLLFRARGVRTVVRGMVPIVRYGYPFALFGTLVSFAGSFLLFVSVGPETNVAAHLTGYVFGYFVALVVVARTPRVPRW